MFLFLFYILGWVAGIILMLTSSRHENMVLNLLAGHMLFSVGLGLIFCGVGHLLKGKEVAKSIGWVSNGFQHELGFAALGIGVCGLLAPRMGLTFSLALIIITTFYLVGAAIVHMRDISVNRNFKPGNLLIIAPDILIPGTIILLWYAEASKYFFLFGR